MMKHTEPSSSSLKHDHAHAHRHAAERGTQAVVILTAVMMVVEIAGGYFFNSMALLADGWHMSSHVLAIGLNALAYIAARRLAHDPRYTFGTWKIEILAAFASAIILLAVAIHMAWESSLRLWHQSPIDYESSMLIAAVGLTVNLASAWLLHRAGHAEHDAHHATQTCPTSTSPCAADHHKQHTDLNLRAAYLHVLSDALTSVLAIVALALGMSLGWAWSDAVVGILGGILVAIWAIGLIRDTGPVLLDREMDHPIVARVRGRLSEAPEWGPATRVTDLRLWRTGRTRWACLIRLTTNAPQLDADTVRSYLSEHHELTHLTVEVHREIN
jgi:cation diffusion facilitator family transporter